MILHLAHELERLISNRVFQKVIKFPLILQYCSFCSLGLEVVIPTYVLKWLKE